VPAVVEDDAGSEASEWERRERREREEDREAEVEALGGAGEPGNRHCSYRPHRSWRRRRRGRGTGALFLCLLLCDFLGSFSPSLGQAWAEGKGEPATSRLVRTADRKPGQKIRRHDL